MRKHNAAAAAFNLLVLSHSYGCCLCRVCGFSGTRYPGMEIVRRSELSAVEACIGSSSPRLFVVKSATSCPSTATSVFCRQCNTIEEELFTSRGDRSVRNLRWDPESATVIPTTIKRAWARRSGGGQQRRKTVRYFQQPTMMRIWPHDEDNAVSAASTLAKESA